MFQRVEQRRLRGIERLRERLRWIDVEAQRQRVDAVPDQVVVARHRLSRRGNAHDHVGLPGQARQQPGEAGEQRREQARAATRAQSGAARPAARHPARGPRARTRSCAARAGAGRSEVRAPAPRRESATASRPRPRHASRRPAGRLRPARNRRSWPAAASGFADGAAALPVQRAEFAHQHPPGPAVADDVVRGQQQQVFVLRQAQQFGPEQRLRRRARTAFPPWRAAARRCAASRAASIERRQDPRSDMESRSARSTQKRLAVRADAGAQRVVPVDQVLQRPAQRVHIEPAAKPQRHRQVEGERSLARPAGRRARSPAAVRWSARPGPAPPSEGVVVHRLAGQRRSRVLQYSCAHLEEPAGPGRIGDEPCRASVGFAPESRAGHDRVGCIHRCATACVSDRARTSVGAGNRRPPAPLAPPAAGAVVDTGSDSSSLAACVEHGRQPFQARAFAHQLAERDRVANVFCSCDATWVSIRLSSPSSMKLASSSSSADAQSPTRPRTSP